MKQKYLQSPYLAIYRGPNKDLSLSEVEEGMLAPQMQCEYRTIQKIAHQEALRDRIFALGSKEMGHKYGLLNYTRNSSWASVEAHDIRRLGPDFNRESNI